jgi:hypothetical protein
MKISFKAAIAAAATMAAVVVPAVTSASASASVPGLTPVPVQATTTITNRPDGGTQGNTWALDNFTRVATVTLAHEVAVANCPGSDTGHCYLWNATIKDTGHFTTIAGQLAPRTGTLDTQVTGRFAGGSSTVKFFGSWKTAKASRVPVTEDDQGVAPGGRSTTTNWVEQFFGNSAVFNSAANPGGPDLGNWGWTYTAGFGSNSQCPNDAYRWADTAANQDGSLNTDGNILTPNAADCT